MFKQNQHITYKEALSIAMKFCAYQERCKEEVCIKLKKIGVQKNYIEDIIIKLITENFLNELRFAKQYVQGKLKIKHWGRKKIYHHLILKKISPPCIQEAIDEINDIEYTTILRHELNNKKKLLITKNNLELYSKLANYLTQKGFEFNLIHQEIRNIIK